LVGPRDFDSLANPRKNISDSILIKNKLKIINNNTNIDFPEEMQEVARIFYKYGLKIDKSLKEMVQSRKIDPSKSITVIMPIEDLDISRFSL